MDAPTVSGYRLGEQIGVGGSGSVWRAERLRDGRACAIKVVRHAAPAPDALDAAVREFAVLQRVRVEGLVRCHDAVVPTQPTDALALVLDLVDGGSLGSILAARGHLSVGEAVTVVSPVARTLAGLHELGVVHADLSPGNVLLEVSGRPVLADLGVARLTGEAPGDGFGTEGFTAPEVACGAAPVPASDVYAVGALAWWCVTGSVPAPLPLRQPLAAAAPGLPPAFVDAVERCLAPQPGERPSAAEAALLFFDAASCEPLRLVVGRDEVALLTHRLRASAPLPEPAPEQTAPRARTRARLAATWARSAPRLRLAGLLVPPAGRQPTPPVTGHVRVRRPRPLSVVGVGVVLAGVVMGGIAAAGAGPAMVGQQRDPSPAAQPARHASAQPTSAQPTSAQPTSERPGPGRRPTPAQPPSLASADTDGAVPAGASRDLRRSPGAPAAHPLALLRELSRVRAALMNTGDRAALHELDIPGSSAWAADARVLHELKDTGQRFSGVAFTVRSARTLRSDQASAQVEAVIDTAAHTVHGPGGRTVTRPSTAGAAMVFHLRWSGGSWRVERVSRAAP